MFTCHPNKCCREQNSIEKWNEAKTKYLGKAIRASVAFNQQ